MQNQTLQLIINVHFQFQTHKKIKAIFKSKRQLLWQAMTNNINMSIKAKKETNKSGNFSGKVGDNKVNVMIYPNNSAAFAVYTDSPVPSLRSAYN